MSGSPVVRISLAMAGFLILAAKLGVDLLAAKTDPVGANLAADVTNYAWPLLEHVHIRLWQGEMPLWNPFLSFGSPVAGELGLALFFPVHWLVFFFEVPLALLLIQFVTVAIAASGMYCYGRFLNMTYPAALLTSGLFSYIVFTESFHHSLGSTICLLPWILRAAQDFTTRPGMRRALVLGSFIALCFLAGFPNYFYYTLLVTGLSCFLLSLSARGQNPVNYYLTLVSLAGVAVVLFLGIIAVQLLPTLELASESIRSLAAGRIYNPESLFEVFSLESVWRDLFSPSSADLYGNPMLPLDVGIYYLGAAVFLIPIAFIAKATRRSALVLLASLVFLLLFALSYKVPALWPLQEIPLASSLRMNGRVIAYIQALLAVLAGLGLTGVGGYLSRFEGAKRVDARFLVPLVALLAISGLGFSVGHRGSLVLVALAGVSLLLYLFSLLGRRSSEVVIWALALGVLLDVSAQRSYRVLVPAFHDKDERPLVASAGMIRKSEGDARVLFATDLVRKIYPLQNLGSRLQLRSIGAYTNFTLARWRNLSRQLAGPEDFDAVVAKSIQPRFYGEMTPLLKNLLLANTAGMDILSLRYVISDNGEVTVRDNAMPRAYTVSSYTMATSEEEALEQIGANMADLSHSVVLEGAAPFFPSAAVSEPATATKITYDGLNRVAMTVALDEPAVLVFTDAFFPGWGAWVDGQPTTLLRANSLFRAVAVDAGEHRVEFIYRPTALYIGLGLSVASLVILAILLRRLPGRGRIH